VPLNAWEEDIVVKEGTGSTRASTDPKGSANSEVARSASGLAEELDPAAEPRPDSGRGRVGAAIASAAVALVLAACLAVGVAHLAPGLLPWRPPGRVPGPLSARRLLESPDIHEVAADNLMSVGRGVLGPGDRRLVRATVAESFRRASSALPQNAPSAAAALDSIQLDEQQQRAVLHALRLIGDRRVQSIGLDVAVAIHESPSKEQWVIVDHIHRRLRPRLGEVRRLHDELIPISLRGLVSSAHHWDLTLAPANLQSMANVTGWRLGRGLRAGAPAEKPAGVLAGAREEARYLLDVLRLTASFLVEGDASVSGALAHALDLGAERVSCQAEPPQGPGHTARALACPLKFGTQGVDALRAIAEMPVLRR